MPTSSVRLLDIIYSTKRSVILDYLLRVAARSRLNRRTLHLAMTYYDVYAQKILRAPSLNVALVCLSIASGMVDTVQFDVRNHYLNRGFMTEAPSIIKSLELLTNAVLEKLEYRLYWKTPIEKIISYAIRSDRCIARTKQDLYLATLFLLSNESAFVRAAVVARRVRIITNSLFDHRRIDTLLKDSVTRSIVECFQNAGTLPALSSFCNSVSGNCTVVTYLCPEIENIDYGDGSVIKSRSPIAKVAETAIFTNCLVGSFVQRSVCFFDRTDYLHELGSGTFGIVGAIDVDGTRYALKKVYSHIDRSLFLREINNHSLLLETPSVVRLDSIMYTPRPGGARCYLWMDLADEDLYTYLQDHPELDVDTRVRMISELVDGVVAIHSKGVVHRDLSCRNILVKNGKVLIGDLGSAKPIYPSLETDANESFYSYPQVSTCVCAAYTRPIDVIMGNAYYSYDFDVWSLGCLIYWIIKGRPLFYGSNEEEIIKCIYRTLGSENNERLQALPGYVAPTGSETNKSMAKFSTDYPRFAPILRKCFSFDNNKRPSAVEVRDMLFG